MTETNTNRPQEISATEWQELINVRAVREGWGLSDETPEDLAAMIYGVKFAFVSGGPGYCGDLYILQGDALAGPPLVLCRSEGILEPVEFS
jgi:hypothetical protein